MSHFYGTLQGSRGQATRQGHKKTGMTTYCASWEGAVRCNAYWREDKQEDWIRVEKTTWQGAGESVVLYDGPIGTVKESFPNLKGYRKLEDRPAAR